MSVMTQHILMSCYMNIFAYSKLESVWLCKDGPPYDVLPRQLPQSLLDLADFTLTSRVALYSDLLLILSVPEGNLKTGKKR